MELALCGRQDLRFFHRHPGSGDLIDKLRPADVENDLRHHRGQRVAADVDIAFEGGFDLVAGAAHDIADRLFDRRGQGIAAGERVRVQQHLVGVGIAVHGAELCAARNRAERMKMRGRRFDVAVQLAFVFGKVHKAAHQPGVGEGGIVERDDSGVLRTQQIVEVHADGDALELCRLLERFVDVLHQSVKVALAADIGDDAQQLPHTL